MYKNSQEYSPDLFVKSEEALAKVGSNTLLVVVDVNRANYTECPELIGKCRQTVVIDHHRQADDQIENATLSYVEPYASSHVKWLRKYFSIFAIISKLNQ